MAAKYKEYYKEMVEKNRELFDFFKEVHDAYIEDEESYRAQFNAVGAQIVELARDFERRLCSHSEGGQYGKYAASLADKFWDEIRKTYPRIDFVGTK